MELLIVTGQSGAGKTRVINALEDIGYYCVDNIPPALLGDFADLNYSPAARYGRTAIVMDARSGRMFRELPAALEELHRRRIPYRILFLEASDDVLLRRYKENPCWMTARGTSRTPSGRRPAYWGRSGRAPTTASIRRRFPPTSCGGAS